MDPAAPTNVDVTFHLNLDTALNLLSMESRIAVREMLYNEIIKLLPRGGRTASELYPHYGGSPKRAELMITGILRRRYVGTSKDEMKPSIAGLIERSRLYVFNIPILKRRRERNTRLKGYRGGEYRTPLTPFSLISDSYGGPYDLTYHDCPPRSDSGQTSRFKRKLLRN